MNNEITIEDFRLCLLALWKQKYLIISMTILTTLIGLFLTRNSQTVNYYSAQSTIYSAANGDYQESSTGTTALISYSDIATSKKVCELASSILIGEDLTFEAEQIQGMIGVSQSSDNIVVISASSEQPEIAIRVANAAAEAFVQEVTSITGYTSIQILDSASRAWLYLDGSRTLLKKRLLFCMLGFVISGGFVAVSELFSNKVRTVSQCISENEEEILTVIPYVKVEE